MCLIALMKRMALFCFFLFSFNSISLSAVVEGSVVARGSVLVFGNDPANFSTRDHSNDGRADIIQCCDDNILINARAFQEWEVQPIQGAVSSATLSIVISGVSSVFGPADNVFSIYGYEGDGIFSPTDWGLGDDLLFTADFDESTMGTRFDIDVTSHVQSIVSSSSTSVVGFNFRIMGDNFPLVVVQGLSETDPTVHPTLTITTVPVPAAVWLFGSALLALVSLGRRRVG